MVYHLASVSPNNHSTSSNSSAICHFRYIIWPWSCHRNFLSVLMVQSQTLAIHLPYLIEFSTETYFAYTSSSQEIITAVADKFSFYLTQWYCLLWRLLQVRKASCSAVEWIKHFIYSSLILYHFFHIIEINEWPVDCKRSEQVSMQWPCRSKKRSKRYTWLQMPNP